MEKNTMLLSLLPLAILAIKELITFFLYSQCTVRKHFRRMNHPIPKQKLETADLLAKLTFRVAKHGELNPRLAFFKLCIAIKGVKKIIVKSLTRYFFILTDTASKVCEQNYTEIKEGCIRGVGAYKRHVSCQNAIPQGTYSISKAKRWELKTPWKEESYSLHPGDGS